MRTAIIAGLVAATAAAGLVAAVPAGSMGGKPQPLNQPIVGVTDTMANKNWLTNGYGSTGSLTGAADGGVF